MKIIGIGGTNGAGKDLVSDTLADKYGWLFVSTSRDLLIPELKRRGLPLERKHMAGLSAEWRRQHGTSVVVDKAVEKFQQASKSKKYVGLVLSSLRHPWEVDRLHELGGNLVWVDADPKIRYNRIFNRGQGDKDQKSFDQFLAEEKAEMSHADGDHHTLNMSGVKAAADILIENNGDDLKQFEQKIKEALGL